MKIELWQVGKSDPLVKAWEDIYQKKILPFCDFKIVTINESKKNSGNKPEILKSEEAVQILKKINPNDILIALDERGVGYNSLKFAQFLTSNLESGKPKIIFLIGGAYGFDETIYKRANYRVTLSALTFSHQVVRIVFLEQLFRAFTIVKGIPYHHD